MSPRIVCGLLVLSVLCLGAPMGLNVIAQPVVISSSKRRKGEQRIRRILRLPEVMARTGRKHAPIYEGIANGTFPAPIPLGKKAVGWVESEIEEWIAARIAERDQGTASRAMPLAARKPSHPSEHERDATR